MFKRALRHSGDFSNCSCSLWKLIGGCGLPAYLMLWFLWPSSLDLGLGWAGGWDGGSCAQWLRLVQPPLKTKESDCLRCCRRNEPEYMVTMYPGETLALFKLWVLNWLLSSCSARATFLLFMLHLQESTGLWGSCRCPKLVWRGSSEWFSHRGFWINSCLYLPLVPRSPWCTTQTTRPKWLRMKPIISDCKVISTWCPMWLFEF